MADVVVFPDTVSAVCAHLGSELAARGYAGIHVGRLVPAVRPSVLVQVNRTGGTRNGDPSVPLEQAQVTVDCWGPSPAAAHDLAQLARALARSTPGAYRVDEISGPADVPDPLSNQPRFRATYLITVRGAAV